MAKQEVSRKTPPRIPASPLIYFLTNYLADLPNAIGKTFADFAYTKRDERQQMKMGNAIQTLDYTYNSRGWLTGINDPFVSGDSFSQKLYYGTNPMGEAGYKNGSISGQKTKIKNDSLYFKYVYDKANRLMKSYRVIPPNASSPKEEFTYDKNGNFTNVKYFPSGYSDTDNVSYQYFAGSNKLSGVTGALTNSFTYDFTGNLRMESDGNLDYRYSYFNRLTKIIIPMGRWSDNLIFGYSPDGQRVYKNLVYQYETSCGEPGEPQFRGLKRGAERSADSGSVDFGLRDEEQCIYTDSAVTRYYNALGMVLMETGGPWVSRKNYIYAGDDKIAVVNVAASAAFYYLKDHRRLDETVCARQRDGV